MSWGDRAAEQHEKDQPSTIGLSMSYSIEAAIQNVLDTTDLTDPWEISVRVVDQMPEDAVRQVLTALVKSRVLIVNNANRQQPHTPTAVPEPTPGKGRNKAARIRTAVLETWRQEVRQQLRVRVNIVNKMYADMTPDDFQQVAAARWTHARGTIAEAEKFETHGKLLAEHGVERFGDLPEEVQAEAFGIEHWDQAPATLLGP